MREPRRRSQRNRRRSIGGSRPNPTPRLRRWTRRNSAPGALQRVDQPRYVATMDVRVSSQPGIRRGAPHRHPPAHRDRRAALGHARRERWQHRAPALRRARRAKSKSVGQRSSVWQVDERIAPDGDADRNANQLAALPADRHPMPVTDADLGCCSRALRVVAARALRRGPSRPRRRRTHRVVGTGAASGRARALTSTAPVFTIGEFNGRDRMTLGVDVVNRAGARILLVTGADKADVVARWVRGARRRSAPWIDETLPVAAIELEHTVVYLDRAAAAALEPSEYAEVDPRGYPVDEHSQLGYRPVVMDASSTNRVSLGSLPDIPRPAHLRELFATDPGRSERYVTTAGDLRIDWSKALVDDTVLDALLDLADSSGVEERRDAMFAGEHINVTEDRAVGHAALRMPRRFDVRDRRRERRPRRPSRCSTRWAASPTVCAATESSGTSSTSGSAVPTWARRWRTRRCVAYRHEHIRCSFVSNVDGADIASVLADSDPASTLFVVASKTFGTIETLTNARTARAWLVDALGESAVADHFVAVSTNAERVAEFGIDTANMFGFWDWVGGRYSVDSAIGLSLMIAIGPTAFARVPRRVPHDRRALPHGPARSTMRPWSWRCSGSGTPTGWATTRRRCFPTANDLARFAAYLQQLDMESNGKSVDLAGQPGPPRHRTDHLGRARHERATRVLPTDPPGDPHHPV